jgi:hypothetical protein
MRGFVGVRCAPVAPPPQRDDTNSWAATLGFGGRSTSATASQSEESPAKVEKRHASGHCPLTLAEVAVFIKGLGYPPQTPIFVAGGAPPPTQGGLKALAKHFPNVYHKEAMLPEKDLLRFQGSSMQVLYSVHYYLPNTSQMFVYLKEARGIC